jgi:hypothetical protein
MKVNFFEGGRRVVLIITITIVCIGVGYAFFSEPYISNSDITYNTYSPNDIFHLSQKNDCKDYSNNIGEIVERETKDGVQISIKLCFIAQEFSKKDVSDKIKLIPYKLDEEEYVFGADKNSPEIIEYISDKAYYFELTDDGYNEYKRKWWEEKINDVKETSLVVLLSVLGLWFFSCVFGWILRGFLGIRNGQDFRVKEIPPTSDLNDN